MTGEKKSRILGVDLENGRMVGSSSPGQVDVKSFLRNVASQNQEVKLNLGLRYDLSTRARKKSISVGNKMLNNARKRSPLWIGRVDYTIREYDQVSGVEKFNLTYSELKPLNTRALSSLSLSPSDVSSHALSLSGNMLPTKHIAQYPTFPLPLISTPSGDLFFTDEKGASVQL